MVSITEMIIARATATAAPVTMGDIPDWGPTIIAVSMSLTSVAFLLVLLRLTARWRLAQLGWDDACIVIAIICSFGHSINDVISVVKFGYGKHEIDLPADIRNAGGANLGFWISQILTKPSLCATRLSFCALYLRVFRGISGRMRLGIKICMSLIVAYYFAAVMATLFTCTPVERNWNKKIPGYCFNNLTFIYVNAGANIIIDLVVVALPLPVIAKLQRNRREIAFGTIILAIPSVLVSILRLPTLGPAARGQKAGDTSWAVTQSTIWTVAELNVPIMACCLVVLTKPIINILTPILKRIPALASRFRSTNAYSDNSRYGTGKPSGSRFNDSRGWRRTNGEEGDLSTVTTIGGGDGGFSSLNVSGTGKARGRGKVSELTSDGASDESILARGYPVAGERERGKEQDPVEAYELGGIVRTVAVDIKVSER